MDYKKERKKIIQSINIIYKFLNQEEKYKFKKILEYEDDFKNLHLFNFLEFLKTKITERTSSRYVLTLYIKSEEKRNKFFEEENEELKKEIKELKQQLADYKEIILNGMK